MNMTKKTYSLLILIFSCTVILSGCGTMSSAYKAKESEVTEYNDLVASTLTAYGTLKVMADNNKEVLLDFIFTNKNQTKIFLPDVKPIHLTEDEIKLFERRSVIYDDYYTSLGSDGLREVLVIKGLKGYIMYVTLVWSEEGITLFEREIRHEGEQ